MSFTNQQPWAGVAGAPDGIVVVRTANFMTLLDGTPVGVLAGQSGSASVPPDMAWDWMDKQLFICTQSGGSAASTTWTQLAPVGPFIGTTVTVQTLNASSNITDSGPLTVGGTTTLNGNTTVGGTLGVTGNTTVGGSLVVTGPLSTTGSFSATAGGTLGGVFTGSPTFNFPLTMTNPIRLANTVFIQSADTSGTYRTLIGTDASNQTYMVNVGGANTGILNQAGSQWLIYSDNTGHVTVPMGSFTSNGPITANAGITTTTLAVSGTASITGALTTSGGIYPNVGLFNIAGMPNFNLYSVGGHPLIGLAASNYIQYDGTNIAYNTTGAHYFYGDVHAQNNLVVAGGVAATGGYSTPGYLTATAGITSSGTVQGATLTSTGAINASGSVSCNTVVTSGTYGIAYAGVLNDYIGFYTTATPGLVARTNLRGDLNVTTTPSDARLKQNVGPAGDALASLAQFIVHSFDMQFPHPDSVAVHHDFGLIADELEAVAPECVIPAPSEWGFKSLNLVPLVARLVRAVQQLTERVAVLEGEQAT